MIKHPTVESDAQVRFRSPRDGSPLLEIELDKIIPNEFQPRRIFNEEKLQELADSIVVHGIIQPLVVLARTDGTYEILVGERRYRAAKIAGLSSVPAFVREGLSAQAKLEISLIENIQRADLNPIEEAKAYQQLSVEFGLTQMQIAKRVGKNHSTVANLMRLLNLPAEIQKALVSEEISEGQARPLLTLRDREEMLAMFKIVVRDKMKVRDIENKVREIVNRKIRVREMFIPDPFIESLENQLRDKLGTRVEVSKKAKGGQITIQFYSDDELKGIIEKLT
ncbi:MAG: ParB/RepB/Spo0J family partition protein [Candidatus Doudnabacteria bacterium]|nr:ParB/RepB/Spo0J family partition protein [Candidatus Doudnabacteria bacterium]